MILKRLTTPLIAVVAGLSLFGTLAAPANAVTPISGETLNVTLIGDSYSAGNGAGSY